MTPPIEIVKPFPKKNGMQQYRLAQLHEFVCDRCGKTKKSKLVVIKEQNWSKILCNGCYGESQSNS